MILALLVFAVAGLLVAPVAAATTEVTVTKLASDDQTVIDQRTVSWEWMKDNLPVLGDGETIYYNQGPIFEGAWDKVHPGEDYNSWNPTEDVNLEYKDHGEFMGTDVKNLCNLVGGADPDEMVDLKASDGFRKTWPAEYIYTPNPRQGSMGIAWYHGKDIGYVNESFDEGMRLYFFANTTNKDGMHVWGNWDMHESWDGKYWYYFQGEYPSASGNSVKMVNRIIIHSNDAMPEDWFISLNGSTNCTLNRSKFVTLAADNYASFEHDRYGLLEGANLSAVIGLVDDDDPTTVNETLAAENYTITVYGEKKGADYVSTFYSTEVTDGEKTYVLGNRFDGIELNKTPINDHIFFPLYLQGTGVDGTQRALEGISKIELDLPEPGSDVIFEGDVFLPDSDVTVTSSQGADYSVPARTPLGALDTIAKAEGFTYAVTDKKWDYSGILMLNDIGTYPYGDGKSWSCYVNGVKLDDYANPTTDGLNKRVLVDGDNVNFYYGPKGATTSENAEAAILLTARLTTADIIYSGEVTLGDNDVAVTADSGKDYNIRSLTPLGALDTISNAEGFSYAVTDKKWDFSGILLLNDIGTYTYGDGKSWSCHVNGMALDDYSNPSTDGLNTRTLVDGDRVNFYYGPKGATTAGNAEAAILLTVKSAVAPVDWTLTLKGACDETVTKAAFEEALACRPDHTANWTDPETGDVWAGMPLWMLVAMVDDEESGNHYTFNDELAAEGYSVKVISEYGYDINIPSAYIARNSGFIVANTLNGEPLPLTIGEKNKPCWPLQIKGSAADAGQLVGDIATIELVGLPQPSEGWTLKVCGAVNDTITQAEFEEAGCHGGVEYTDDSNRVWSGVPLWYLVGVSDNIETRDHWTFDDELAATNYTVRVIASDGWSQEYGSKQVARSNGYILADKLNGQPIPADDKSYPLKLVGDGVPKSVKSVAEIDLVDLIPGPAPEGSWNLDLKGKIDYTCTEAFFEQAAACPHHTTTWTNSETGETWSGIPLRELCGWVDDRVPHGPNGFNALVADAGYKVIVTAGDGYSKEFSIQDIVAQKDDYIVANTLNGTALPNDGDKAPWPLRLVGPAVSGSFSVGSIASIELTEFEKPTDVPAVHIVKYAADRTTVLSEETVDYTWMEKNLKVYGDGETHYYFEGLNFPPDDPWDQAETYPGSFKIDEQMMGTSVRDLCELAGGMGPGTEITFAAPDGWETTLHYDNIYAPMKQQGEAVLAWYTGRQGYVPDYKDGYRLFFAPEDHVFGQWDMHECIDEKYWHYNSGLPSCAGLSAKYISEIRIYDVAEPNWNLQLDGAIDKSISKGYFESGLACTMGANHEKSYTDKKGREWSGMPLWFLLGYVDDENFHTGKSFNATLAAEGYDIHVIGSDGSETIIDSCDAMYSDNYILANSLNGVHIAGDDDNWPLRLVGQNVSGMDTIKGVVKISFIPPNLEDEFVSIGDVSAGSEKALNLTNGAFTSVTIKAASDIADGELAVGTPDELPNYIDRPTENIYQYLHIVYPAPENTIDEAVIAFDLPLTWLNAHGMTTSDVTLMRYTNGAWESLPTTFVREENGRAYFTATTDRFCYFAVGGTAAPAPTPTPVSRSSTSSISSSSAISAFAGSLQAGEKKAFRVGETAISKISISAYDQVSDLLVTVKKASLPSDITAPEGQVYELEEVTLYRADLAALDGITLEFTVPSTWLESQGVGTGDIAMLRYVDGAWKHLETKFIDEKGGNAIYSAESTGFSYFAIATVKGEAAEPEETQPSVDAPAETPTEPASQKTETTVPATTPTETPVFWGLPLIALGALLVLRRK